MSNMSLLLPFRKKGTSIQYLVNHLLYKGFIKKSEKREDRRITFIELTELGLSMEEKYRTISKNVVETAYKEFTEDEKKVFLTLLKKMNTNFKNANADGGSKDEGDK